MTALRQDKQDAPVSGLTIRVRGRVQGVGFRPHVWCIARELGLWGFVLNDGEGVLIHAGGEAARLDEFMRRVRHEKPPLAEISSMEAVDAPVPQHTGFIIAESGQGAANTEIAPDASCCDACRQEVLDPFSRRYRYAFATCTNCGPRLTVVTGLPYDRPNTTLTSFTLCADCQAEYDNPADRRFHAQTIACYVCGPKAALVRFDGKAVSYEQHSMLDDVDAAMSVIQKGEILAIKAIGGYQLACDATRADAVDSLRARKKRDAKPFALMMRDMDVVRLHCKVSPEEEEALTGSDTPIVLLERRDDCALPDAIAPGLRTLGVMLPSTPMHHLMFRRMTRPVVMTSGNISNDPQIIDDDQAKRLLAPIADYALVHNRPIANRIDDSVVRVISGRARAFRRGRGQAPSVFPLPAGFADSPDVTAYGGDVKSAFGLLKGGELVLSQHQGDLASPLVEDEFSHSLALYGNIYQHRARVLACDAHQGYHSTKLALKDAKASGLPTIAVQHHHAHAASCMLENGRPLAAPQILAIAIDGSGAGTDGTVWGGEFLLCDYERSERLATFKPVALPGGDAAVREPWRNLMAHLLSEMGWAAFSLNFSDLEIYSKLSAKPVQQIEHMIKKQVNSPLASSCGRLFDAVAAALGLCFEGQDHEGDAASRLESIVCTKTLHEEDDMLAYPFTIPKLGGQGIPYIEPLAVWNAILGDLVLNTPAGVIAARFHKGLAKAMSGMAVKLCRRDSEEGARFTTVALTGGCFQNKVLAEETERRLLLEEFDVITHSRIPANDGGLAAGQAVIAAAHAQRHATATIPQAKSTILEDY